jgi:pyridoxal phosphate enzyme (YggS family)
MSIAKNIALLRNEIPGHIKIVAVSKTMPSTLVKNAYDAGLRAFGENRVQELTEKHQALPKVPFVHLIHSVDSLKLLSEINLEAEKINRSVDCLLQIRIASEETKFGMTFADAGELLNSPEFKQFNSVRLTGLMGMATFTDDTGQVKDEFLQLSSYFKEIKATWFPDNASFKELSMGMSGDYKLAIEAGSTMVRIGSLIFGERNYNR